MSKRISFVTGLAGLTIEDFAKNWPSALAASTQAPEGVRPVRVAACTVLPELMSVPAPHDGVAIEWFTDEAHLARFDAWVDAADGQVAAKSLDVVIDRSARPSVVVDEFVMRGGDWLEQRWHGGGAVLKQMAIATRAVGLTPAEFSERWRGRAGTLRQGDGAPVTVIPDDVRGLAYIQNHPHALVEDDTRPYDAVNEVFFDDVEALKRRFSWFAEHLGNQTEADLVSTTCFLAVREELLVA